MAPGDTWSPMVTGLRVEVAEEAGAGVATSDLEEDSDISSPPPDPDWAVPLHPSPTSTNACTKGACLASVEETSKLLVDRYIKVTETDET